MKKNPKLIDKLFDDLPPLASPVLRSIVNLCTEAALPVYLVGGPLRDLLLGHCSLDVDICIEGDAPEVARRLAPMPAARAIIHERFRTAVLLGQGWRIDLTTARRETYRRPGALPDVLPATIEEDLRRRDFTINAMALGLNGSAAGDLLDPFNGRSDLESRLVRALHEDSFRDDATRMFRAARYASRLGFRIERRTHRWMQRDLDFVSAISGSRLHTEFALVFSDTAPEGTLRRLDRAGVLAAVRPGLTFGRRQAMALRWLCTLHHEKLAAAAWPLLVHGMEAGAAASLASRLAFTRTQAEAAAAMSALEGYAPTLADPDLPGSQLVEVLEPYPTAAVWALAALSPGPARRRCLNFLLRTRSLKPILHGGDLASLGVSQGPEVGEILRRLRAARLDGLVRTREDEEEMVVALRARRA